MSASLNLAQQLIERPSITPDDTGCQDILIERLQKLNFNIERLPFNQVDNFYARLGNNSPAFLFAGHTDVVPPGPLERWSSHPFEPTLRAGKLYGRGAADMKSSIAAMVVAIENFLEKNSTFNGSIALLITSDEEGISIDGTKKVIDVLKARDEKIDFCLVGEASSQNRLGDYIKIGRRGTLSAKLVIQGIQGHIAYPDTADNPIHKVIPFLNELITIKWDEGNQDFQASRLQISNIHAGTGANNVIPGELELLFNFRYSPEVNAEELIARVENLLDSYQLNYSIEWDHSGKPFYSKAGPLRRLSIEAIHEITHHQAHTSTIGGTSDGRFIAELGCEIIELGPINASIHKIDEHISIAELEQLTQLYELILHKIFHSQQ